MITELTKLEIEIDHLQAELKWAVDYRDKNFERLTEQGNKILTNIIVSADYLLKLKQKQYKNEQTAIK